MGDDGLNLDQSCYHSSHDRPTDSGRISPPERPNGTRETSVL